MRVPFYLGDPLVQWGLVYFLPSGRSNFTTHPYVEDPRWAREWKLVIALHPSGCSQSAEESESSLQKGIQAHRQTTTPT